MDDWQLLQAWVKDDSHPAFALLVQRHLSLVHSAARRQVAGDLTLAEEVTQRTFCLLAVKASVLLPEGSLAGWLHATAGYVARECLRGERRRRFREHQAAEMQSIESHSPPHLHWEEIAPLLDQAIQALPVVDRQAVVSRFFERHSMRDVGRVLGVTEDAATPARRFNPGGVQRNSTGSPYRRMCDGVSHSATVVRAW